MLSRTRWKKKFKFSVCISFPLCSLHSTCCTYCAFSIRCAVCILYWHVTMATIEFIFGYNYSQNTHNRQQNTFPFFSALIFFPFYNNIDITYNVSIVPPTQKNTLACMPMLYFELSATFRCYAEVKMSYHQKRLTHRGIGEKLRGK